MSQLFQEFATPEQKKLAVMVEEMGGAAALENEQGMKELAHAEFAFVVPTGWDTKHGGARPFDVVELRHEIKGNPDEAIEQNAKIFNRKFDLQRRQIVEVEDIAHAVNREGDRIISAVTAGPHDRIVDQVWCEVLGHLHESKFIRITQDIHTIWKDMVSSFVHAATAFHHKI